MHVAFWAVSVPIRRLSTSPLPILQRQRLLVGVHVNTVPAKLEFLETERKPTCFPLFLNQKSKDLISLLDSLRSLCSGVGVQHE